MKVLAKCTARAWDSDACVLLCPGEGPIDGMYEIDRNGKLASLKSGKEYVFQFDRNAAPGEVHDYSCKEEGCGAMFKTLAELGRHAHASHKNSEAIAEPEDEEIFADRTCTLCTPHKICKSPYGLRVHQEKSHGIKRVAEAQDEVAA